MTNVTKKKEGEEERLFLLTGDEFLIALTLQRHRDITNCQVNRLSLPSFFLLFLHLPKSKKFNDIFFSSLVLTENVKILKIRIHILSITFPTH